MRHVNLVVASVVASVSMVVACLGAPPVDYVKQTLGLFRPSRRLRQALQKSPITIKQLGTIHAQINGSMMWKCLQSSSGNI